MPAERVLMDKIIEGDGRTIPKPGSVVTVEYVGYLAPDANSSNNAATDTTKSGGAGDATGAGSAAGGGAGHGSGGAAATAGSTSSTYGKKFDSTMDRKRPFIFRVGVGEVIKGWDEGIRQMSKGERSRMHIPATLAYGEKGFPGLIPPSTPIIFEVTLLDVT